jgi:unsaturated rhamnogalacturonyl hydrolase
MAIDTSDAAVLRTVADTLLTLPYEAWHFGDSVAFEGMLAASDALNDDKYLGFAHGFIRSWRVSRPEFRPLDCTAAGSAMCEVFDRTGDRHVLDAAIELGTYLIKRPMVNGVYQTWETSPLREPYGPDRLTVEEQSLLDDPGPGVFVDCLHFDPPFFAHLGASTGDQTWSERASGQALGYVDLLQDLETGLFHHFFLPKTNRRYVPGWGRGQGWALLGLLDVIGFLEDTPVRQKLARSVQSLIAAMLRYQRDDGHWNAVVNVPDSGPETSTAAFMVVGFRRAIMLGIVPPALVELAVHKARSAVLRGVEENGNLAGVSAAVWASTKLSHYSHVPLGFVVPWGQGPVALMLAGDQ